MVCDSKKMTAIHPESLDEKVNHWTVYWGSNNIAETTGRNAPYNPFIATSFPRLLYPLTIVRRPQVDFISHNVIRSTHFFTEVSVADEIHTGLLNHASEPYSSHVMCPFVVCCPKTCVLL